MTTLTIYDEKKPKGRVVDMPDGDAYVYVEVGDMQVHFGSIGQRNRALAREFAMTILNALVNYGGGLPEPVREPEPAPVEEEIPL